MGTAVDVDIGIDATEIVEVIEEGEYELDTILFCSGDGVVEAGDAVFGVVIEILAAGVKSLEVDIGGSARIVGGAEAPHPGDFVASLRLLFIK